MSRSEQRDPFARRGAGDSGVHAPMSELVALRSKARLPLLARAPLPPRAPLAGSLRSPFRGRGMEFAEVRAYQPGDDVRCIDWRVTARTGRVHTKLFHEERESPVWLACDAGPTMHFGTRAAFKSVMAVRAAAVLAWAARDAGHRIGAVVRDLDTTRMLPARLRDTHLLRLLATLSRATDGTGSGSADSLAEGLRRLREAAAAGSRVFVLSDFYGLNAELERQLIALARRCDVDCVLVYDALEAEPPPSGRYRMSDGESVTTIASAGETGSRGYPRLFAERRAALEALCGDHRIGLRSLCTDADPASLLEPSRATRGGGSGR